MRPLLLAAAAWAAMASALDARQEGTWVETRFHRVHLRNGNVVDGDLVRQDRRLVTLEVRSGEIGVRTDLIARDEEGKLRIEVIKIRSLVPPPPRPEIPDDPDAAPPPETTEDPDASSTDPPVIVDPDKPFVPSGSMKEQVNQIVAQLRNADPALRAKYASMLPDTGEGWPAYLASVLDGVPEGAMLLVIRQLEKANDPQAAGALQAQLRGKKAYVRAAAVHLLSRYGDERFAVQIRPLLRDPEAVVRRVAAAALQDLNDRDSFEALIEMAGDEDRLARDAALSALFSIAKRHDMKPELVDALGRIFRNLDDARKTSVIQAIALSRAGDYWEFVAGALDDRNPAVRQAALSCLGVLNVPDSHKALLQRFALEREKGPRIALINVMRKLKLNEAIEPIIVWMEEGDFDVKAVGGTALRDITGQNHGTKPELWREWWRKAKPK